MASLIESEEELACLSREIEEEFDKTESTVLWLLTQNCLKMTINNIVSFGDLAFFKTMNAGTENAKCVTSMSASLPLNVHNSENLKKVQHQIASDSNELEKMFVQMRSGELEDELDRLRNKIRELRSKKHTLHQDLHEKKQKTNAEELELAGFLDTLKEIFGDIKTTITCHEQELRKVESMYNDVNYESLLYADICE